MWRPVRRRRGSLPAVRCVVNHCLARSATRSSAPGSSKRWVAPGTISSLFSQRSWAWAARLRSSTIVSAPPTMSRVGARTSSRHGPARSGRPPRDTTAPMSGSSAAARSAAAAPVLAPKYPIGADSRSRSQRVAPASLPASVPMSKTLCLSASSAGVSRSNSSVPRPASCNTSATARLRGLCRLLPEPWANITRPAAPSGRARSPASRTPAASTSTPVVTGAGRTRAGSATARARHAATSSSVVCEKSLYHSPTEPNRGGTERHTTSSATALSRRTASGGATGTARTTRAAPCARTTWHAAAAVAPVAIPSSTTITVWASPIAVGASPLTTVRSSSADAGRPARYRRARRSSSCRSARSTAAMWSGSIPQWRTTSSLRTRTPPSPIAPKASSGW